MALAIDVDPAELKRRIKSLEHHVWCGVSKGDVKCAVTRFGACMVVLVDDDGCGLATGCSIERLLQDDHQVLGQALADALNVARPAD